MVDHHGLHAKPGAGFQILRIEDGPCAHRPPARTAAMRACAAGSVGGKGSAMGNHAVLADLAARYQACTCLGCTPSISAFRPVTIRRWMGLA